ncbi:uncharacterized protein [Lepeophtheirus salmonis]|uniref:uncharacterized protein isoform X1 n=1 Tax=Lepeophtheirus salmonis TaxID=72036 RepID=UPI001AEA3CD0|nr:uncharacterized protein LOC121121822 isoform X1 [Lepeophtheirus salmonis]
MDIIQFKYIYLLLQIICWIKETVCGCCNDNYWCDGDPSFKLTPSASQGISDNFVLIRWSSSYLDLSKCVDYFFIEYFEELIGKNKSRKISPVNVDKVKSLNDWTAVIEDDLDVNYKANISVKPNTQYIFTVLYFKVFAIDKGAGWGELEGTAYVSSDHIKLTTNTNAPKTISKTSIAQDEPESKLRDSVEQWVFQLIKKRLWNSHDKNNYKFSPDIWIKNGDRIQRYEEGKIFGLRRPTFEVSKLSNENDYINVNVTLKFPYLRTTYVWRSFISAGVITLYHTCGKKLPLGSFLISRKLEDVKSVLKLSQCSSLPATVSLRIPQNLTSQSRHLHFDDYDVLSQDFHISNEEFAFDVPWLFSHFHNLSALWNQQKVILRNKILVQLEKVF